MDEASVEQAIKDKLLVDERLLKRLIKAASNKIDLEEFKAHSDKLETYKKAAANDVEYFEQESLLLREEFNHLQAHSARMRISLQTELELEPQYQILKKLHAQVEALGPREDLLGMVQKEEEELETLKVLIEEEEERIKSLKQRLETFLNQFRTNE